MKVSFLKYKDDISSYKIPKGLGMDVFEIEKPEQIDNKLEELKNNNYTTIFIPSDLASFSEKLINNYKYSTQLNIVITPSKK